MNVSWHNALITRIKLEMHISLYDYLYNFQFYYCYYVWSACNLNESRRAYTFTASTFEVSKGSVSMNCAYELRTVQHSVTSRIMSNFGNKSLIYLEIEIEFELRRSNNVNLVFSLVNIVPQCYSGFSHEFICFIGICSFIHSVLLTEYGKCTSKKIENLI